MKCYNPNSEICDYCSNHYFEGNAMYVDCKGEYCKEATLDVKGFSCKVKEELTPQEDETTENTPARVLYKQDADKYNRKVVGKE